MGVPLLVTHFFVFYVSMMGLITPPVAPCCAVAAGLSQGSFIKICWYSIRIGLPLFILPLAFFNNQAFILFGSGTATAILIITLGMFVLTFAINLPHQGPISVLKRVAYAASSLATLFIPDFRVQWAAAALCAVAIVFEFYRFQAKAYLPGRNA
jgi:TRAP-type uncharacterized transport system fused permease subunit